MSNGSITFPQLAIKTLLTTIILLLATSMHLLYAKNEMEILNEGDQIIYNTEKKTNLNAIPKSHALFMLNYATNDDDNTFNIWDASVVDHWDRKISDKYPRGIQYRPPDDLPSRYYPSKGVYSSRNEKIIEMQVNEAKLASIELLVVPFTIDEKEAKLLSPHITSDLHKKGS